MPNRSTLRFFAAHMGPLQHILPLLFVLASLLATAQPTAELERRLAGATSDNYRIQLSVQLAERYLNSSADQTLDHARTALRLAERTNDPENAARAGYLLGRAYENKRQRQRAVEAYQRALSLALRSGNEQLVFRNFEKLETLVGSDPAQLNALFDQLLTFTKRRDRNRTARTEPAAPASDPGRGGGANTEYVEQLRNELLRLRGENESLQQRLAQRRTNGGGGGGSNDRPAPGPNRDPFADPTPQTGNANTDRIRAELEEQQAALERLMDQKNSAEALSSKRQALIDRLSNEKEANDFLLEQQRSEIENTNLQLENAQLVAEQGKYFTYLLGGAALFVLLLALIAFFRLRARSRAAKVLAEKNEIIEEERERSEELLLNILPKDIAAELKEKGKATARKFDHATVLFCDFVNFTAIAERLTPDELVTELDNCFKAFDFIISQYDDLEKIKTIGDAYLCASGLTDRRNIPNNLIRAALEMQEFLAETKRARERHGFPFFTARIGIHTGPVVAGVVGIKKFAYDIWGDTVNVAARLESQCEPGRVNISESTYQLVRYQVDCQHRGKVQAKNKGMIDMYYVRAAVEAQV